MKSVVPVHVKAICTSVRGVALFKERNENGCNDGAATGTRYAEKFARSFLENDYMKTNAFSFIAGSLPDIAVTMASGREIHGAFR